MSSHGPGQEVSTQAPRRGRLLRLVVLLGVLGLLAAAWLSGLASPGAEQLGRLYHFLQQTQREHPLATYVAALALYVFVTGLSIPVANVLSVLYGMLFGFWPALVLVSFGSTAGATLAMLLARYVLRPWVQRRFGSRLEVLQQHWQREGAWYLFSLRLAPVVPFWFINLAMGLLPVRVGTFWWISQLGMLPGTVLYVGAGASLDLERLLAEGPPAVFTPGVLLLFSLLAAFPLVTRWLWRRLRAGKCAG